LVFAGWYFTHETIGDIRLAALSILGVIISSALLSAALEFTIESLGASRKWSCRIAFLTSLGVFLLIWWAAFLETRTVPSWSSGWLGGLVWTVFIPLGLAGAGAFTGGIMVTLARDGLWEDNSPPSQVVLEQVQQRHAVTIGTPTATPWPKRAFDILLSIVGLLLSAPVWLASVFLLWFEDPGPLLFVKNSVGRGGVNFRQYKYRTMVRGAEESSGPVLSQEGDPRVLRFGRLLRKTALDELPQLLNILKGEMSFVGPRPQRTVLVLDYLERMPEYAERHGVLPGLAGLAQVAGDYYLTPRQKLRFDRLYIRHVSLGFDLKLISLAFLIAFWFRWRKGWNGRLPRRLLHGRPKSG
jgi:lipopolysaccharide/colanic/teichoic acid biosynthesis glycosyltransferase